MFIPKLFYTPRKHGSRSDSRAGLATAPTNPALLSPMQQASAEWVQLLERDGADPTRATIVRLAVDGLWMVELFGLAAPDPAQRKKVLHAQSDMIDQYILPLDEKGICLVNHRSLWPYFSILGIHDLLDGTPLAWR